MVNPAPASFWIQANALLRKNLTFQKRNVKTNIRLILFPLILCVLLVVLQRLIDNQLDKPKFKCGCVCANNKARDAHCHGSEKVCGVQYSDSDQFVFCAIPNPPEWPPSLATSGSNRFLAGEPILVSENMFPSVFTISDSDIMASLAENVLCPKNSEFSFPFQIAATDVQQEVRCAQGLHLWRNSSSEINNELYKGYQKGNPEGQINEIVAAYDFLNSNENRFNVSIWYNSTYRDDNGFGPVALVRIPLSVNLISNAYLQSLLGPDTRMLFEFVKEMPKPETQIKLEIASLLGGLFFTWVILQLFPVVLTSLVYEKQQNLRIMMKMHGLGDGPYWMISYSYFLAISVIYMFCFVIFGSVLGKNTAIELFPLGVFAFSLMPLALFSGLKFFTLNDYSIQFVFYFIYINLQISLAFLGASLFSNAKTATVTAYIGVFGTGLLAGFLFQFFVQNTSFPNSSLLLLGTHPKQIRLATRTSIKCYHTPLMGTPRVSRLWLQPNVAPPATQILSAEHSAMANSFALPPQIETDGGQYPEGGSFLWSFILGLLYIAGLYEFAQYSSNGSTLGTDGMRWQDLSDSTNGMKEVLIIMFAEWKVMFFAAYYIDKVLSSGSGKSPLFFLKGFLRKPPSSIQKPSMRRQVSKVLVQMEKPDVIQEREKVEQLVLEPTINHAIVCDDLKKVYPGRDGNPEKFAVRGLFLAVPRGECFGMLGPNGAGKTSFISMMIGLTKPTSGTAFVQGLDIRTHMDEIYTSMGVCPQYDLLWESLTGREHLLFMAGLKILKAVEESLKSLNLFHGGVADKQAGKYSGGMKRRLSVAIALIGDPRVVYMDEPSTGLDPASRKSLWNVIKLAKRDRAIILTTHSMEEAEALCDRLGIFVNGSLQCVGNPKELKARYGGTYVLTMTTSSDHEKDVENMVHKLTPNANRIYHISGTQKFELPKEEVKIADVFRAVDATKRKFTVFAWGLCDTTLEDVFIKVAREAEALDA
ncbi:P-loop containing nucleoside triphosphate hydrolase [Sesbania bispinosa]|nr:P-loop containing nucleoside triphosphate hydrolase [Sesbania bispinosa]